MNVWPGAHRLALLSCLAGALGLSLAARADGPSRTELRASSEVLRWMWSGYTRTYLHPAGYVTDPLRDGLVTSEAQSYAMLQAVWLRDHDTFNRVATWTRTHLQRTDGLHSWLYDPRAQRVTDENTATDADVDIAFALLLASHVFQDDAYRRQAVVVVRAIRHHATLRVGHGWFPSAGNWAQRERITNLSYFAPYAYEYFDRIDPQAGWPNAIATGYRLIDAAQSGTARLPADFTVVSPDGTLQPLPAESTLSRHFSFDGVRIIWRLDLDCRLTGRPAACRTAGLLARLEEIRHRDRRFVTVYGVDASPQSRDESLSFYGAFLPAYARLVPHVADDWRRTRLSPRALVGLRGASNRYYDANWVWFGLASAGGYVATHTPPPSAFREGG